MPDQCQAQGWELPGRLSSLWCLALEQSKVLPIVTLPMSLHLSVSVFPPAELTHCFQGTALPNDNGQ